MPESATKGSASPKTVSRLGGALPKLDVRGTSLEFVERGRGDPLVLVHGSVSDHRTWGDLLPRFAERFRTITFSRRYHWPNQPIDEGADYSMPEHVEDLGAVLDATDAEPAHLVGHSYGGYLVLLLAISRPRSVRSMVLVEPPVVPLFASVPPKPSELLRLLLRRPRTALELVRFGARGIGPATAAFERGDPESGLRRFGTTVLGRDAFERLSEARMEQTRANLIPAEFLGSGFAPLCDADVESLTQPTLLVGGARSPRLFGLLLDRLEGLIPTARRATIPNASHIVHEDEPERFFRCVSEFLDSEADGPSRGPRGP